MAALPSQLLAETVPIVTLVNHASSLKLKGLNALLDGGSLRYTFEDNAGNVFWLKLLRRATKQYTARPRPVVLSGSSDGLSNAIEVKPKSDLELSFVKLIAKMRDDPTIDKSKRALLSELTTLITDRHASLPPVKALHIFSE